MSDYDDTNRGVFFREKEKKNPKGPDYKGKLNVDGKEYEIAGWIKESKAGNKFMSLSVQEPRAKQEQKPKASLPPPGFDDDDAPLPF